MYFALLTEVHIEHANTCSREHPVTLGRGRGESRSLAFPPLIQVVLTLAQGRGDVATSAPFSSSRKAPLFPLFGYAADVGK
ncbi:hypothetical protein ACTXT7_001950 [Hymenolepis weldensis]